MSQSLFCVDKAAVICATMYREKGEQGTFRIGKAQGSLPGGSGILVGLSHRQDSLKEMAGLDEKGSQSAYYTDRPLGFLKSGREPTNSDFANFEQAVNNKAGFLSNLHGATSPNFYLYGVIIIIIIH